VVKRINAEFVPIWIDIRTQPVPAVPGIERTLGTTKLDASRRIVDDTSQSFFVRNLVLDADGTLLNPEHVENAPFTTLFTRGHFPYAQTSSDDFLEMFDEAFAARARRRELNDIHLR